MLIDEPEMPVEFECCDDKACRHRTQVEQWRADARQINEEVEREMAAWKSQPTPEEKQFEQRVDDEEKRAARR